jgi:hypothetical protein
MAVIDIGAAAIDRNSTSASGQTVIDENNESYDTGTLDTFELWANSDLADCKVGTFDSPSYTKWTMRDYETIGSVTSGSKQTFTGKNCYVVQGDRLGSYFSSGAIEKSTTGYYGIWYKSGDKFDQGEQTYSFFTGDAISAYATGTTGGGATVKPHYYYLQQ